MKKTPRLIILLLLMTLSMNVIGQSVCYFKIINIDNRVLVQDVIAVSDSKKCKITKLEEGVFKVMNLKNKAHISFNAKGYELEIYERPKKRYEIARDMYDMFVLHDNDTMEIQLLPNDFLLLRSWGYEDSAYGDLDTNNCVQHPQTLPTIDDTLAFFTVLNENIVYPQRAIEENAQGRVLIGAVVETDGSLTNIHIKQGIDKFLDRAALRAVRNTEKLKLNPAIDNGLPVRCIITIPVYFHLE